MTIASRTSRTEYLISRARDQMPAEPSGTRTAAVTTLDRADAVKPASIAATLHPYEVRPRSDIHHTAIVKAGTKTMGVLSATQYGYRAATTMDKVRRRTSDCVRGRDIRSLT